MPTWVLHGVVLDAKSFFRHWILGSGILIGYWCRCGRVGGWLAVLLLDVIKLALLARLLAL
jgi:hypothetical protein